MLEFAGALIAVSIAASEALALARESARFLGDRGDLVRSATTPQRRRASMRRACISMEGVNVQKESTCRGK
eukprot:2504170-Pleurochrysis_carterae.AAC.1